MKLTTEHILVSRVDAIGDVVLTLPLCGYLKSLYPNVKISFLGRTYTRAIIESCNAIDHFVNFDELKDLPFVQQVEAVRYLKIDVAVHVFPQKSLGFLLKKAGVRFRIGTTNRIFHWYLCNRLVSLSRKNSNLHEAQLNICLLKPLGIITVPPVDELPALYNLKQTLKLDSHADEMLDKSRFNLVLHPMSNGSASEWGLSNFSTLISMLPDNKFNIIITGSAKEKIALDPWLKNLPSHVKDAVGHFSLTQLIAFIAHANGLVAASTGPLHIAAAYGINTLGLYPSGQSVNVGRWGPLGIKAAYISSINNTLNSISVQNVLNVIYGWQ
jgi:heptosyltransferase-3